MLPDDGFPVAMVGARSSDRAGCNTTAEARSRQRSFGAGPIQRRKLAGEPPAIPMLRGTAIPATEERLRLPFKERGWP